MGLIDHNNILLIIIGTQTQKKRLIIGLNNYTRVGAGY